VGDRAYVMLVRPAVGEDASAVAVAAGEEPAIAAVVPPGPHPALVPWSLVDEPPEPRSGGCRVRPLPSHGTQCTSWQHTRDMIGGRRLPPTGSRSSSPVSPDRGPGGRPPC